MKIVISEDTIGHRAEAAIYGALVRHLAKKEQIKLSRVLDASVPSEGDPDAGDYVYRLEWEDGQVDLDTLSDVLGELYCLG